MQPGVCEGMNAAALANAIAIALAKNLTSSEQNVLGNFIAAVGATILTIAAVAQTAEEQNQGSGSQQNESSGSNNTSADKTDSKA